MKNKMILLMAISILLMTNCKKENPNNDSNNISTLLSSGKWTIDSTIFIHYQNDTVVDTLQVVQIPAYFDFFNSTQAYYRNISVFDTTNYQLVGSDILLIDLNNDNLLDTTHIITLVQNQKLLLSWTNKYSLIYKNVENIYMHK